MLIAGGIGRDRAASRLAFQLILAARDCHNYGTVRKVDTVLCGIINLPEEPAREIPTYVIWHSACKHTELKNCACFHGKDNQQVYFAENLRREGRGK